MNDDFRFGSVVDDVTPSQGVLADFCARFPNSPACGLIGGGNNPNNNGVGNGNGNGNGRGGNNNDDFDS